MNYTSKKSDDNLTVTVVIIAKHAEETIGNTLSSLVRQTQRPYEVIIIVDDLKDTTVNAVKCFLDNGVIRIIRNKYAVNVCIRNFASARATGIEVAKGAVVAFIDADCIAHPQWIEHLSKFFVDNPVVLAQTGRIIGINCSDDNDKIHTNANDLQKGDLKCVSFAPTANFAFKKNVVDIVGNFDPWFDIGGEDRDFCIRLKKAGVPLYYNPYATVYHKNRSFTVKDYWRTGAPIARISIKHGKAVLGYTLMVLFHFFSILLLVIFLIMDKPILALVSFAPSLLHRFYRAILNYRQGASFGESLHASFVMYLGYVASVVEIFRYSISRFAKRIVTYRN